MIFTGPICWLGQPTTDGRRIDALEVDPSRRLPVLWLPANEDRQRYEGTEVVGEIDLVGFEAAGRVTAVVTMNMIEPKRYACGVDLDSVADYEQQEDGLSIVLNGRLIAVTVYEAGIPAFPDAHLEPA